MIHKKSYEAHSKAEKNHYTYSGVAGSRVGRVDAKLLVLSVSGSAHLGERTRTQKGVVSLAELVSIIKRNAKHHQSKTAAARSGDESLREERNKVCGRLHTFKKCPI